jgi:hypothetical protein
MVDKEYTIGKQDLWMQDKFGDKNIIITYNSKDLNKPDLIIWVCSFHMILDYEMVINTTPFPNEGNERSSIYPSIYFGALSMNVMLITSAMS